MKHAITGKTTPTDRTDWARVRAMTDADIQRDEDSPATTPADWEGAVMKIGKTAIGQTPRRRGPGKKPARIAIQLRLPPDVLARWKADGPGWQTRMANRLAMPVE